MCATSLDLHPTRTRPTRGPGRHRRPRRRRPIWSHLTMTAFLTAWIVLALLEQGLVSL